MSAAEFTTEEMVDGIRRALGSVRRENRGDTDVSCILRSIAARLSDPWSAFAGWQPPPEPERADGFRYLGWSLGGGLWEEIVWWSDRGGRWSDATGNTLRGTHAPTAFAPLPPPPKESTNG